MTMVTHGDSSHGRNAREWHAWCSMKSRCYNQANASYPHYGGRGIVVCERWKDSYENFLADMGRRPGPGHSLDRLDVNGNYEPVNCRWATAKEQARNRTNTVRDVEGHALVARAEANGISVKNFSHRLAIGWDPERAATVPQRPRRTKAQILAEVRS